MTNILMTAAVLYTALVAALYLFQRNLLYHPSHEEPLQARAGVPEMATHRVTTEDGLNLAHWYAPGRPERPVLLYFHGNAGNIGDRGSKVRSFLDAGYGVVLTEYRGFGGNPGTPSEDGLYADARSALALLTSQGIPLSSIVLYGESLGTGIAVQLAAELAAQKTPVGAVVLEAPYSTIPDVAASHYPFVPVRQLVRDRFDSMAKIAAIGVPLLVVHGELDRTVPIRFGKRLFAAAVQPKEAEWVPGARHNNLEHFQLFQKVDRFISIYLLKLPTVP